MSNYFCPECGYEGDDPICPHCNIPTEKLDFSDEMTDEDTYPEDALQKVDSEDPDDVSMEDEEDEKPGSRGKNKFDEPVDY